MTFLTFIPVYREETEFALNVDVWQLLDRLCENGILELLDVRRKNVCPNGR